MESGWVPIITRDEVDPTKLNQTRWFLWPNEQEEMEGYVHAKRGEDVYFSPMLYKKPRSRSLSSHTARANVTHAAVAWADADSAQPGVFKQAPTVTVETSPGRWHAYWRITDVEDPTVLEAVSHAVYQKHKADGVDNGWALSKRLRVPGTSNNKYGESFTVREGERGPSYTLGEIAVDYAPAERASAEEGDMPTNLPPSTEVLNKVTYDPDLLSLYADTPVSDWSMALYRLEMMLFEAGLAPAEVFAVARDAACNKFKRNNRPESELWKHVLATFDVYSDGAKKEEALDIPPAEKGPEGGEWENLDLLEPEERARLPRTFIDEYADWGKSQSARSARQYHEASAFCILSTVFSEYGHIVPGWGNTPLNLYFLVLGKTTRSRKSTAKNLMMRVLDELSPEGSGYDYDLGSDATPEALTSVLSERPGKSSIFWRDEVQGLFSAVAAGGYLRGLLPMLTNAYDGAVEGVLRKTGDKKRTRKTKTNLIFYGMGIVDQVAQTLTDDDFYSGFLPRVLFTIDTDGDKQFGSTDVRQRTEEEAKGVDKAFQNIVYRLSDARKFWKREFEKRVDQTIPIRATDEAWARWQQMTVLLEQLADRHPSRSEVLSPGAQRLGVATLKVAALLAMLDKTDEIQMSHMLTAIRFATEWAKYMEFMVRQVSKTAMGRDLEELEGLVMAAAKPLSYAKALQHFKGRKTVREFNEMVDFLMQSGSIKIDIQGRTKTLEARV